MLKLATESKPAGGHLAAVTFLAASTLSEIVFLSSSILLLIESKIEAEEGEAADRARTRASAAKDMEEKEDILWPQFWCKWPRHHHHPRLLQKGCCLAASLLLRDE